MKRETNEELSQAIKDAVPDTNDGLIQTVVSNPHEE